MKLSITVGVIHIVHADIHSTALLVRQRTCNGYWQGIALKMELGAPTVSQRGGPVSDLCAEHQVHVQVAHVDG